MKNFFLRTVGKKRDLKWIRGTFKRLFSKFDEES